MPEGDRKTVLITGAAGGIGRAASERLSRNGWNVLAVDRDEERLAWAGGRPNIAGFAADVTSEADNRRMVAVAETRFGPLDALILNAAVSDRGRIDELAFETFEKLIAVNLFGAVHGIRAALPSLRKRKRSSIVITSSTMGLAGDAENWAYASSKHALIGLVRSLSRELGWEGIRINALCPGPTRATGMTAFIETDAAAHYQMMARAVPLQRWAEPDEMAAVMEFLISPAASYVNGAAIVADGGAVAGSGLALPAAGEQRVMPAEPAGQAEA